MWDCMWDETSSVLRKEDYTAQTLNHVPQVSSALCTIMHKNKWPVNFSRPLPLLYLPDKARSFRTRQILWRPIAAIVELQVQRCFFPTPARAFTLFLRLLVDEITASFLVLRVDDLHPWVHGLQEWGAIILGECDCSRQFNNMTPTIVMKDLTEAVNRLSTMRC